MGTSLLNNSCNDNDIQNHLFFFTFTNFVNHVLRQAKNNSVEILTGGCHL